MCLVRGSSGTKIYNRTVRIQIHRETKKFHLAAAPRALTTGIAWLGIRGSTVTLSLSPLSLSFSSIWSRSLLPGNVLHRRDIAFEKGGLTAVGTDGRTDGGNVRGVGDITAAMYRCWGFAVFVVVVYAARSYDDDNDDDDVGGYI